VHVGRRRPAAAADGALLARARVGAAAAAPRRIAALAVVAVSFGLQPLELGHDYWVLEVDAVLLRRIR